MRPGIFLLYDQEGHVSDHVLYLLAKFSEHIDDLIVISNGPITPEGAEKIGPYVSQIVIRENEGFDVGGYKHGILEVGFDHIAKYDELVLFNYTVFGPMFDLAEMFGTMSERISTSGASPNLPMEGSCSFNRISWSPGANFIPASISATTG